MASILGNLGIAYDSLGQHIRPSTTSLAHRRCRRLAIGGAWSGLGNLGNAYDSLGQYEKAIDHHTRSLAIAEELGNRQGVANGMGGLGGAYNNLGQYDEAIDHLTRSLAIQGDWRPAGHGQQPGQPRQHLRHPRSV